MEMKAFDKIDWTGFSGCERFADGSEPLIGDDNDQYVVVADGRGISLISDDENYFWAPPAATYQHWSVKVAERLCAALISEDGSIAGEMLFVLGFQKL